MIILLDVGNTRLKWAVARGRRLGAVRSALHAGSPQDFITRLPRRGVESMWVAQVLGAGGQRALDRAVKQHFGFKPMHARVEDSALGLRVAYRQPSRLGVDRWLAMLGLWHRTGDAFCVASAGTALTFDAVDTRGRHQGGLIAPGLRTSARAVLGATRFRAGRQPDYRRGLGRDTESCVSQGALHACTGALEHAAKAFDGKRYLGGGDARTLRPHLEGKWILREHLVLEGLLALASHD